MTDAHAVTRTDPHSHHDVPSQRHPFYAPRVLLADKDGLLTDMGAIFYAMREFRRRVCDDGDVTALDAYGEAMDKLGSLGFHYWAVKAELPL